MDEHLAVTGVRRGFQVEDDVPSVLVNDPSKALLAPQHLQASTLVPTLLADDVVDDLPQLVVDPYGLRGQPGASHNGSTIEASRK